ncbi:MAG: type II toxin-antitoxin system PemK/MazF family toxin [Chloroflexi bacterium]|nr:type II toxin-antitoxin system PemK/MazF family toxin [Chloroflexota bacterium]
MKPTAQKSHAIIGTFFASWTRTVHSGTIRRTLHGDELAPETQPKPHYVCGLRQRLKDPTSGTEIAKTRSAVSVSNDIGNEYSARLMVAPLTSKRTERVYLFEDMVKCGGAGLALFRRQPQMRWFWWVSGG